MNGSTVWKDRMKGTNWLSPRFICSLDFCMLKLEGYSICVFVVAVKSVIDLKRYMFNCEKHSNITGKRREGVGGEEVFQRGSGGRKQKTHSKCLHL